MLEISSASDEHKNNLYSFQYIIFCRKKNILNIPSIEKILSDYSKYYFLLFLFYDIILLKFFNVTKLIMKPANRNTGQVVQSMKDQLNSMYTKILAGTIYTVIIIVFLLFVSALPLTAIIIGSLKINNCTIQSMIPIWLIVGGATGLTMTSMQITMVTMVFHFNNIINLITLNFFIVSPFII